MKKDKLLCDPFDAFKDLPEVPDNLKQQVIDSYQWYLFIKPRKSKLYREAVCSYCGKEMQIKSFMAVGDPESLSSLFYLKQGDVCDCPYCGRHLLVKNYNVSRRQLTQYAKYVFFLPISFDRVYVRTYYTDLHFYTGDWYHAKSCDHPSVEFSEREQYYMEHGFALHREVSRYYGNKNTGTMPEPFGGYGYERILYALPVEQTYLKWYAYERYVGSYHSHINPIRYYGLASNYPIIEYLVKNEKLDGRALVSDFANRIPNKSILDWSASSPQYVWKLSKKALNTWIDYGGGLETLKRVKALGKVTEEGFINERMLKQSRHTFDKKEMRTLVKYAKICGLSVGKVIKYLLRTEKDNPGCSRNPCPDVWITYKDYIENAVFLEYDLKNEVVALPKNLFQSHDVAFRTADAIREQKEIADMSTLTKKLEKKYAYENDTYMICVPRSMKEIIREGQKLDHCVARYATRHAEGKTVILFLRQKAAPSVPWVTIEIQGFRIIQKQGRKNRYVIPDEALQFIDEWLVAVQKRARKQERKAAKDRKECVA